MSGKYTPAPWEAERMDSGRWLICADAEVMAVMEPWSPDVDEADARLIAAAPDLLEALKMVLDAMPAERSEELSNALFFAVYAEAKAEGRT